MKNKVMMTKDLKLDAIAWKAQISGQSYGYFSVFLSEDDKEQIYREYVQLLERQKEEENARLELTRRNRAEKKSNKTKEKEAIAR